ncbi:hypothetical protein P171DRAFT_519540 [Karstenula rhodostoma CBS 690.94]|uniref:Uncharacterized protein n=1 Tax=Karstenula rhodostoma CBS 690.94 TaxID=1392251 RepID=A0A9P4PNH7_9PLEO|nr:hypothetical protein P171DRAFT_519540 [Karstenula rhodostoma CBS 690.94]
MSLPVNLIDFPDPNSHRADTSPAALPQKPQARPSNTNISLRLHTGFKPPKGLRHKSNYNPPWPFSGVPSPQTMHHHILNRKLDKKYFSITLMQPPATPWSPLPSHQNMETRTCFHTGSRIHKLDCGHTVAVPHNAEPCAANCKPPMSTISSTSSALPAPYAAPINLLRASTIRVVHAHMDALAAAADPLANAKLAAHANILSAVWEAQDKALAPPRDLISGDFSCALCGTPGLRDTRAAAVVGGPPYHCVVVGWDEGDVAVIRELEKGVQPRAPPRGASFGSGFGRGPPLKRLGAADDRGHRRSGVTVGVGVGVRESAGEMRRRRRDGWQAAVRRKEKEGVIGRLREEVLMEELGGMGLGGW